MDDIRFKTTNGDIAHIDFDNEEITFSKFYIKDNVSEISFYDIKKLFVIITDLNKLTEQTHLF